ncbi:MAG: helix-hairpin-helix domain-containing protein, partial [Candidatus Sumerlaeia bacterium]|nr:helix-hairpin-helix domain-containing protein [Candidatus Sumerlaeia bacterium]
PTLLKRLAAENNPAIQRQLQKTLQILETPTVLGRININTATFYTLLTLPGITEEQAHSLVENRYTTLIQQSDSSASAGGEATSVVVPFKTISDLLRCDLLWQRSNEAERLQQFARWANMITTNSRAFSVLAHSSPVKPLKSSRRDHPISVYALLALDQTDTPVIFFKYLNR